VTATQIIGTSSLDSRGHHGYDSKAFILAKTTEVCQPEARQAEPLSSIHGLRESD